MGFASKTHWIGVFLLFAASVLLLITTISAPVWNSIGLMSVSLPNGISSIKFGTFGYCVLDVSPGHDECTHSHIGYSPAAVVARIDQTSESTIAAGTSDALTRVMVLHPIECGITFIAFLLAAGTGIIGSFAGAMVALLAWVLTLISLAVDFSLFGILHHHVNADSSSHARFGVAIWCLLAAFVCLFFGMILVFFTCCANRRERRRQRVVEKEPHSPPRRKRFGIF